MHPPRAFPALYRRGYRFRGTNSEKARERARSFFMSDACSDRVRERLTAIGRTDACMRAEAQILRRAKRRTSTLGFTTRSHFSRMMIASSGQSRFFFFFFFVFLEDRDNTRLITSEKRWPDNCLAWATINDRSGLGTSSSEVVRSPFVDRSASRQRYECRCGNQIPR